MMISLIIIISIYGLLAFLLYKDSIKFWIRKKRYVKLGDNAEFTDYNHWRPGDNIEVQLNPHNTQIGYLVHMHEECLMLETVNYSGQVNNTIKVKPFQVLENKSQQARKEVKKFNQYYQNREDYLTALNGENEHPFKIIEEGKKVR